MSVLSCPGRVREAWAIAALMLTIPVLAACGGSSDPESPRASTVKTAPATLSHTELLKAVNAACVWINKERPEDRRRDAAMEAANEAADFEGLARAYAPLVRRQQRFDQRLRALKPSPGEHAFVRYARIVNRQTGYYERILTTFREHGSNDSLEAYLKAIDRNNQRRAEAAIDLGADRCGKL